MKESSVPRIGQPPENRRQLMVKLCWMLLWMVYLAYPVSDLLGDNHTLPTRILGWALLSTFLACYVGMVIRRRMCSPGRRQLLNLLALSGMFVMSVISA